MEEMVDFAVWRRKIRDTHLWLTNGTNLERPRAGSKEQKTVFTHIVTRKTNRHIWLRYDPTDWRWMNTHAGAPRGYKYQRNILVDGTDVFPSCNLCGRFLRQGAHNRFHCRGDFEDICLRCHGSCLTKQEQDLWEGYWTFWW
jgi:hypothetical protein